MSLSDLGVEIQVLVYHLYRSRKNWFHELCLRTRVVPNVKDNSVSAPSKLCETSWFPEIVSRREKMYQDIVEKQKNNIDEMTELVTSIYPQGCPLSDLADVIQTCASLASFTVPSELIKKVIVQQGEVYQSGGIHKLTLQQLQDTIIKYIVVESFVPSKWWTVSHPVVVTVTRVGLSLHPPGMAVEYTLNKDPPRHRSIQLGKLFTPDGPTSSLAKRLAETHDCVLSEVEIQKYLIRLQRCAKQESEKQEVEEVATPSPVKKEAPASTVEPKEEMKVESQKADLGLLYRDPEKALLNVDLNDADDLTLKEFKEKMNEAFESKAITTDHPDYVYDKRVDVGKPTKKSDWDSDSD